VTADEVGAGRGARPALSSQPVYVRYVDGQAQVRIGARSLEVERRDDAGRTHTCPLELVTAALGS
jgi:hypothetical protein